ncbi:MAG: PLDc_N domain-containing protein [Actinobacteria bacterium]|nr:PLDc_N domain-containing protein [Actinomycetota bacterium]
MPRAIPVLIVLGLAIYSFFDVLNTEDDQIRRFNKPTWLILAFLPVVGAALWFLIGRPARSDRNDYEGPRVISLKSKPRPVAPDDDASFLRRLDEDVWLERRRKERMASAEAEESSGSTPAEPEPGQEASDEKEH